VIAGPCNDLARSSGRRPNYGRPTLRTRRWTLPLWPLTATAIPIRGDRSGRSQRRS